MLTYHALENIESTLIYVISTKSFMCTMRTINILYCIFRYLFFNIVFLVFIKRS